jgi:hypothetical protein
MVIIAGEVGKVGDDSDVHSFSIVASSFLGSLAMHQFIPHPQSRVMGVF